MNRRGLILREILNLRRALEHKYPDIVRNVIRVRKLSKGKRPPKFVEATSRAATALKPSSILAPYSPPKTSNVYRTIQDLEKARKEIREAASEIARKLRRR